MTSPQFPGGQNMPPMGRPPGFPSGPPSFGPPMGPPSGFPSGPPSFGPSPGFPSGPPMGPPTGQPGGPPSGQMPTSAPPEFVPFMPTWQQGSSGIHSCLFTNTYIWTFDGANFWFFPIAVTRDQVFGYRWSSRNRRWSFRVVNRRNIIHYQCFR